MQFKDYLDGNFIKRTKLSLLGSLGLHCILNNIKYQTPQYAIRLLFQFWFFLWFNIKKRCKRVKIFKISDAKIKEKVYKIVNFP